MPRWGALFIYFSPDDCHWIPSLQPRINEFDQSMTVAAVITGKSGCDSPYQRTSVNTNSLLTIHFDDSCMCFYIFIFMNWSICSIEAHLQRNKCF